MATKTPRTRDGQIYPGGKSMRGALKNLAARKSATAETIAGLSRSAKSVPPSAYREPGSMKG